MRYQFTTELAEMHINATEFVEKICKHKHATDQVFWKKIESAFDQAINDTGGGILYW